MKHLPGTVFVFNDTGRMVFWNPHLEEVTGWRSDEIREMHPLGFFTLESRPEIDKGIHAVFESGYGEAEGELLTRWNGRKPYRFAATRVEGEQGVMAVGLGIDIGEQRRAERALRESEERFRAVFEQAALGIAVVGWDRRPRRVNRALEQMLGRSAEDLYRFRFEEITHPEDAATDLRLFSELLSGTRPSYYIEKRFLAPDGRIVWAGLTVSRLGVLGNGRPEVVVAMVQDKTEGKRSEDYLRRAFVLFDNTQQGVIVTDAEQTIISVNPAFCKITGYTEAEVRGKNPRLLRSGYQGRAFYEAMWLSIRQNGWWEGEIWNRRKDGSLYLEWLHISVVRDNTGEISNYIGIFSDITEHRESEEQLDYLAYHDSLTGLPNRRLFLKRVEYAMSGAKRRNEVLMVALLDLDHFQEINETLGHPFGDRLLQTVARHLAERIRASDTLACGGGDKFWVLFEELKDENEAYWLAESFRQEFPQSLEVDGRTINVTTSFGFSCYPTHAETVEALCKNAEAAMYHVKRTGRNDFRFYTDDVLTEAVRRMKMRQGLHRAIEENELVLHYQPQFDLHTTGIVGMEALVRWNHPEKGMVPPTDFIPIAEEMGLIRQLSDWILKTACAQGRAWLETGIRFGRLAVNLSAAEMRFGDIASRLQGILDETGFPAEYLEIEITETSVMDWSREIGQAFAELRQQGITVSIDDFGTGYSSLVRLRELPIDKLKMDKSFVADVPDKEDCIAILRAMIAMAHALGLVVVAEGVETELQRQFLIKEGCDCAQGFFWARPQASPDFEREPGSLSLD